MTLLRIITPTVLTAMVALAVWMQPKFDDKNADPGTVASQFTAAPKAQPGRWESVVTPESQAGAAPQLATPARFATCFAPDDSIQPAAAFFSGGLTGCSYENYSQAEGRLQGALTCRRGGARIKVTFSGTYSADAYEVHSLARIRLPGGEASRGLRMTARHTGDCKGGELDGSLS